MVDYHTLLEAPNGQNYIPAYTVDGVHPSAAGFAVMTPHTEQALQAAMATRNSQASLARGRTVKLFRHCPS